MQAPNPHVQGKGSKESAPCPKCRASTMYAERAWYAWTYILCLQCVCALCCDCAYGKVMKCQGCGHRVTITPEIPPK